MELTQYWWSREHAGEIQVTMKEGDCYFLLAEMAEGLQVPFGESC